MLIWSFKITVFQKLWRKKPLDIVINNYTWEYWCFPYTSQKLSQIEIQNWQKCQIYINNVNAVLIWKPRLRKSSPVFFSLNDFHWIQWIHWIMTKFKNSMVTRNSTQLATCTLPVEVMKITFPSLALVGYLLPFTSANEYQTRCSRDILFFATASGNVSDISYGVSLVTIPLLDPVNSLNSWKTQVIHLFRWWSPRCRSICSVWWSGTYSQCGTFWRFRPVSRGIHRYIRM